MELPVVTNTVCKNLYRTQINNGSICAGGVKDKSGCNVSKEGFQWKLTVTSRKYNCEKVDIVLKYEEEGGIGGLRIRGLVEGGKNPMTIPPMN